MEIGEEWAYRLRDEAPSERVKIWAIERKKTSSRVDVEFLDDSGRKENVPGSRFRVPWHDVAAFDEEMANWDRIYFELTDPEQAAVSELIETCVPQALATCEWSPVRYATAIHDRGGLATLLDTSLDELLVDIPTFEREGVLMISPEGTLRIAQAFCARHSAKVLPIVMAEEAEIREKCKRGAPFQSSRGNASTTSPEWEYEWYLKYHKPKHELLRQWCGHRAVTFHERLQAAEAEVRRLDVLVARLVDQARERGDDMFAEIMEQEHNGERITPESIRPVPDRPLAPYEIPVREVSVRRRWW